MTFPFEGSAPTPSDDYLFAQDGWVGFDDDEFEDVDPDDE
jgi:hypothetical protein